MSVPERQGGEVAQAAGCLLGVELQRDESVVAAVPGGDAVVDRYRHSVSPYETVVNGVIASHIVIWSRVVERRSVETAVAIVKCGIGPHIVHCGNISEINHIGAVTVNRITVVEKIVERYSDSSSESQTENTVDYGNSGTRTPAGRRRKRTGKRISITYGAVGARRRCHVGRTMPPAGMMPHIWTAAGTVIVAAGAIITIVMTVVPSGTDTIVARAVAVVRTVVVITRTIVIISIAGAVPVARTIVVVSAGTEVIAVARTVGTVAGAVVHIPARTVVAVSASRTVIIVAGAYIAVVAGAVRTIAGTICLLHGLQSMAIEQFVMATVVVSLVWTHSFRSHLLTIAVSETGSGAGLAASAFPTVRRTRLLRSIVTGTAATVGAAGTMLSLNHGYHHRHAHNNAHQTFYCSFHSRMN